MKFRRVTDLLALLLLAGGGLCWFANAAEPTPDLKDELPRIPPTPAADALATLEAAPGFRLEQVACEPLVTDPVAMAFDESGRLYVIEMRGYSEQPDDLLGQVRLLTDVDQDGVFDQSTVFADNLSWPTAVCCYDGGVFVGVAPDILYLKDLDGDGKADDNRVVFTGFGRSNVQGLLNSFQWGLDNRIHGATSSSGGQVGRPGDPAVSLRGRDFSFNPRTLELRPESGGRQHGLTFDRWGRKFVCSNSDHLRAVLIPDRYLARNPFFAVESPSESVAVDGPQAEVYRQSPVEPWRTVRTRMRLSGAARGPVEGGGRAAGYFTSATGVTIYEGDAWPAEYREHRYAIVGDVGSNIIHRKWVANDGVSFRATRVDVESELVAATDIWFRPVQFCNGPDGALYVADFYREVIEHPASLPPAIKKHLDLTSGRDRGRIYRIVPETFRQPQRKLPAAMTAQELVEALSHPNGWHRQTAARLLFERGDRSVHALLAQHAEKGPTPVGQVHAMWLLASLNEITPALLEQTLADPHPRVREQAALIAGDAGGDAPQLLPSLARLADDDDPRVRFSVALALGGLAEEAIAEPLARLLVRDAQDPWIRAAVYTSSADVLEPLVKKLEMASAWADSDVGREVLAELEAMHRRSESSDGGEPVSTATASHQGGPLQSEPKHQEVIDRYRTALGRDGSAAAGEQIFKKHCATCHDVARDAGGIAPSAASFRNRGDEFILVNVIDPNREVNPQYQSYTVRTIDGLTFVGIVTAETATSMTLTAGRDQSKTFLKVDLELVEPTGSSLMPENLHREIDQQQMVDLIEYLTPAQSRPSDEP